MYVGIELNIPNLYKLSLYRVSIFVTRSHIYSEQRQRIQSAQEKNIGGKHIYLIAWKLATMQ